MNNCHFSSVCSTILSGITEESGLLRQKKNSLWKNIGTKYCYYMHMLKIQRYLNVFGLPNAKVFRILQNPNAHSY